VNAVVADVGVELAEVFVAEFVDLELYQHVALEHAVVEDEVHEKRLTADEQTLLARLKAEPMAEFQQKGFKLGDQGRFQLGLWQDVLRAQP
jgi:hypothetical protein